MIRYLKNSIAITTLAVSFVFAPGQVFAGDLEWSGMYRIEGNAFHNLLLRTGEKKRKEYGVHQLILRPKIVAGDGLYINSQFNLATSGTGNGGNQLGVVFGDGLDNDASTPSVGSSGSLSESQQEEMFAVSQFYLTHVQEFGTFIAGRAPVQFGLGITHNAGRGLFDHYMDTRDLVGYKVVMGNFYFLPMWAKVKENGLAGYDDVSEWLLQAQYENPETDTEMGVMYWTRKANQAGNDTSLGSATPDSPFAETVTFLDDYNYKLFSIYFARKFEAFNFGLEVANQSGNTGVNTAAGDVKFSGMGVALEMGYKPTDKKWDTGLKAGWATGDDKDTLDEYEGFAFDRNYDVALMMFNHGLGQGDFLHSKILGTNYVAGSNTGSPNADPDIESIGNVMYVSPYINYKWSDRWTLSASLTTGWLDQTKLTAGGTDGDNGLGYEFDFSFNFSPNERVSWQNTFGWFEPGSAFELPGYGINSAYGFMSRAAISF